MKIILNYDKSIEENASNYYQKAKKSKRKIEGATTAIEMAKKELEKKKLKKEIKMKSLTSKKPLKKEWYEKFHWFISSENFLVIGGKDAITNEIIIKKHLEPKDIVFHTDMTGSPFVVIKSDGKMPGKITLQEAADFTASNSKAWSKGFSSIDVFYVHPDQVSKQAESGEYLSKGAFMIRGKTNYLNGMVELCFGNYNLKTMCGPPSAIKKHCEKIAIIIPGTEKTTDIAKKILKIINTDLDEIVRKIPSGGCKLVNKPKGKV